MTTATDHIIVIPVSLVTAFMAAVEELEQRANHNPSMEDEERAAIATVAEVADLIAGQRAEA